MSMIDVLGIGPLAAPPGAATMPLAPPATPATGSSLDGLVADGRAIGVRVVLDLTGQGHFQTSATDASVKVPAEAWAFIDGLPPYGC